MFERFKLLPQLWRTGRLVLRLLRDPRAPLTAKVIFGATVVYLLSPLDLVPDWIPVFGQADDLVVLMAGFNLFLRACPSWLVQEHEAELSGQRGRRDDEQPTSAAGAAPTIDGQY